MNAIFSWLDGFWAAYKARKAARARADLEAGKDILDQAQREAQEMRAAAEAMEARKRLDTTLSGVPIVPAAPASAEVAPVSPVPGSVPNSPDADTTRIRKP